VTAWLTILAGVAAVLAAPWSRLASLLPVHASGFAGLHMVALPLVLAAALGGGAHWAFHCSQTSGAQARGTDTASLGQTAASLGFALALPSLALLGLLTSQDALLRSVAGWALGGLLLTHLAWAVCVPSLWALWHFRPPGSGDDSTGRIWRREGLATVGLAGYAPLAPGTLGALACLPLAAVLAPLPWLLRLAIALLLSGLAVVVSDRYLQSQRSTGGKPHDPQQIVLDEFVGCLIAVVCVPWHGLWVALAFGLFRAFDMGKPGPVGLAERNLPGGLGIVGDDVVAGLLAGALAAGIRAGGVALGWWG